MPLFTLCTLLSIGFAGANLKNKNLSLHEYTFLTKIAIDQKNGTEAVRVIQEKKEILQGLLEKKSNRKKLNNILMQNIKACEELESDIKEFGFFGDVLSKFNSLMSHKSMNEADNVYIHVVKNKPRPIVKKSQFKRLN